MLAIGAAGLLLLALVDPDPVVTDVRGREFPGRDTLSDSIQQVRTSVLEAQR